MPYRSQTFSIKDLNLSRKYTKNQKASSILRVGFARSKRPHFNSTNVVRVPFLNGIAVCKSEVCPSIGLQTGLSLPYLQYFQYSESSTQDVVGIFQYCIFKEPCWGLVGVPVIHDGVRGWFKAKEPCGSLVRSTKSILG